jgi:hypothetical protein
LRHGDVAKVNHQRALMALINRRFEIGRGLEGILQLVN